MSNGTVTVLTLLIAASAAIFGSFLTFLFNIANNHFKTETENKKVLREKYEEFFNAIYEINNWIKKVAITADKKTFIDAYNNIIPEEVKKIVTLSTIYFPNLKKYTMELYFNIADFNISLCEMSKENNKDKKDKEKDFNGMMIMYIGQQVLVSEADKYTKKYTGV